MTGRTTEDMKHLWREEYIVWGEDGELLEYYQNEQPSTERKVFQKLNYGHFLGEIINAQGHKCQIVQIDLSDDLYNGRLRVRLLETNDHILERVGNLGLSNNVVWLTLCIIERLEITFE